MSIQSPTSRRRRETSAHPRAALRALLTAALTFGLAASVAARAEETPEDTVVVTATRGQSQSILSSPVPVDSIDRDQLRSAGSYGAEFGQALQSLVPSFNFQRQSNSGAADIVRPAQLRGMSPDQVLVLVNGKRRHTTAVTGIDAKVGRGTAPVDFNSLPTNAIGRVEVLRDGAGAQYGSDAIAGVINVILDERPEGIETRFSYGGHVTGFDPTGETLTDGGTFNASGSPTAPSCTASRPTTTAMPRARASSATRSRAPTCARSIPSATGRSRPVTTRTSPAPAACAASSRRGTGTRACPTA